MIKIQGTTMKFLLNKKFYSLLLVFMLVFLPSIKGIEYIKKDSNSYAQEQCTPLVLKPDATVRQIQSIKVTPEISFVSQIDVAYMNSIINLCIDKIDSIYISKNEEVRKQKQRESITYLCIIPAFLLLSVIGIWIGSRVDNNFITWLSIIIMSIDIFVFLWKVPPIL